MDSVNLHGYKVPLIPSGLRHEETIIQTANVLEYLNNTINEIFDRIDNRVNKNNEKIKEIQNRIEKANNKILSLVGTKKAICIYSPAKFPGVHVLKDVPATFSEEYYKNKTFTLNTNYEISSDLEPLTQTSLQDKLEFFHVRETQETSRVSKILNASNGLGPIPCGLKSVNSILLYNTTQNVYIEDKEKFIFKSQAQVPILEDKNEFTKKTIEAPPISITNRQLGTEKKLHQKLFYTPKLNDAPNINLPIDLPDLPGIADNIHFEASKKPLVSLQSNADVNFPTLTKKLENKNGIEEPSISMKDNSSQNVDSSKVKISDVSNEKIYNDENIANEVNKSSVTDSSAASLERPLTLLPPIPPPPPPPPLQEPTQIFSNEQKSSSKIMSQKIPDISDVRSNLMEAIRNAGGTRGGKLRAAADIVSPGASISSKPTSNNLMDDLHKKLLMRRKGISGAKENDKSGNVLDILASIIPPPPKPSKGLYSSTSDNDNDNDDWD